MQGAGRQDDAQRRTAANGCRLCKVGQGSGSQRLAGAYCHSRRAMGWLLFRGRASAEDTAMILVDTSVIVAWMDPTHPGHRFCSRALDYWAGRDQLAISAVTYAELAAGARNREGVDEDLRPFQRIELDFDSAWRAGRGTPIPSSQERESSSAGFSDSGASGGTELASFNQRPPPTGCLARR